MAAKKTVQDILKAQTMQGVWLVELLSFFLFFIYAGSLPVGAQPVFPAEREKVPLLISDHHADHGLFMFRYFGTEPENRVCMVVLDAHTDTVENVSPPVGNHDWISSLYPFPLKTLIWIHTIAGFPSPNSGRVRGFYSSVSGWGAGDPPLNARAVSLGDISHIALSAEAEQSLFISIDLDFFYMENSTPTNIPYVFDVLFDFSSRWQGKVIWALALSRSWLPDDEYAWELLRQSLRWFSTKTCFTPPELTLFTAEFKDSSAMARSYREKGLEVPSFYGRENEMPDDIRELFAKLRTPSLENKSTTARPPKT